MEIGIFGANGTIGQRIAAEALGRGHKVTAFTRDASRFPSDRGEMRWEVANVVDAPSVAKAIGGLDVLVNSINCGTDVPDMIANASVFPAAARALLTALEQHPTTRLIVVGGAGSLEVAPGIQLADSEGFADKIPGIIGFPPEYIQVVLEHREALNLYRLSNRNWTYISPPAGLIGPGERTGYYRMGGNQLLVNADGTSDISAEDLAVALMDEVEFPRHIQRRFTVCH